MSIYGIKFVMKLEKCPICNVKLEFIEGIEFYDRSGFNKDGFNKHGYDAQGYDRKGFDKYF